MEYGARIERGKVLTAAAGSYTVASLDRDGITSPAITAVSGSYSVGDTVLFFLFRDGTGKILCPAEGGGEETPGWFDVTITDSEDEEDSYTADKTAAEILAALAADRPCRIIYNGIAYPCAVETDGGSGMLASFVDTEMLTATDLFVYVEGETVEAGMNTVQLQTALEVWTPDPNGY